MNPWREAWPWYAATLVAWCVGVSWQRSAPPDMTQRPPWQRSFLELSAGDQHQFISIREAIDEAEASRVLQGQWPSVETLARDDVLSPDWERRTDGLLTAYLQPNGRWLVLLVEPDAAAMREPAAPEDEEHHRWPDGGTLHLTVWKLTGGTAAPSGVPSFPAGSGYEQIVIR